MQRSQVYIQHGAQAENHLDTAPNARQQYRVVLITHHSPSPSPPRQPLF
jgi:hypothetical protein